MASRSLCGIGALVAQDLRATQATGLLREVMMSAQKGTKAHPNLVPSITNKQIVGCIFEEDNSAFILFWPHRGEISDALAEGPITSWCPTSWPTQSLH
ncbi:unnamed protein product [Nyctereutes procyonoides]|uniref:Cytochrome c oxidase subunit 5B, mitochondrial n=1 Tax=Nyctereutes procyonoides TaxID=34880 RepID=A0A811Z2N4_NYCPR|nr:unnamed protein product [Nyctereutes procyonoides]